MKIFEPKQILFENENQLHFLFEKEQSSKLRQVDKYYTKEGAPYITKISFSVDDSNCNLKEKIEFSNGSKTTSYYHLISKSIHLQKAEYYASFDFE